MLSRHSPNYRQASICPELPDRVEPAWSTDDRNQFGCAQLPNVRNGLKQLKLGKLGCLREQLLARRSDDCRKRPKLIEMRVSDETGDRIG
jgi:hypothetical protein